MKLLCFFFSTFLPAAVRRRRQISFIATPLNFPTRSAAFSLTLALAFGF